MHAEKTTWCGRVAWHAVPPLAVFPLAHCMHELPDAAHRIVNHCQVLPTWNRINAFLCVNHLPCGWPGKNTKPILHFARSESWTCLGSARGHWGCWEQNTSRIQMMRHFELQRDWLACSKNAQQFGPCAGAPPKPAPCLPSACCFSAQHRIWAGRLVC